MGSVTDDSTIDCRFFWVKSVMPDDDESRPSRLHENCPILALFWLVNLEARGAAKSVARRFFSVTGDSTSAEKMI
jgi:hypothetical protein